MASESPEHPDRSRASRAAKSESDTPLRECDIRHRHHLAGAHAQACLVIPVNSIWRNLQDICSARSSNLSDKLGKVAGTEGSQVPCTAISESSRKVENFVPRHYPPSLSRSSAAIMAIRLPL